MQPESLSFGTLLQSHTSHQSEAVTPTADRRPPYITRRSQHFANNAIEVTLFSTRNKNEQRVVNVADFTATTIRKQVQIRHTDNRDSIPGRGRHPPLWLWESQSPKLKLAIHRTQVTRCINSDGFPPLPNKSPWRGA